MYNLCSEKNYDPSKFGNRVSQYGFEDHNAPPFELIQPCCEDISEWLDEHVDNVAIVHCKAGKGRTGVMICSYLLYKRYFCSSVEALDYYAEARTKNCKGVTIPSQRRYITYYGYFTRHNCMYMPQTILLNSVTILGVPTFNSGTCNPSLVISQTKVVLYESKTTVEVPKNAREISMDIGPNSIPICGDVRIDVFHKDYFSFKKKEMLVLWFNTYFVERGVTYTHPDGGGVKEVCTNDNGDRVVEYTVDKCYIDRANKDKKDKLFPGDFAIRLNLTIPCSVGVSGGERTRTTNKMLPSDSVVSQMSASSSSSSTSTPDDGSSTSMSIRDMSLR